MMVTSPSAHGLRPPLRCALSHCAQDLGSISPTAPDEHRAAWWRGNWSCCCRRIPQSVPEGLFLSEKILLLSPAAQYEERPVLSHSPPQQLDRGLSGSGPHTAQLSTLPSQRPQSLWVYHFVLIPLPATSSNQVSRCCSSLVRQGMELLTQLSPRSPTPGLGLQLPWSPGLSQGLFVLKQSPYCLFFQCPLYLLVSYLHQRWGTVSCSLCSSVIGQVFHPRAGGSGLCSHLSGHHLSIPYCILFQTK